MPTPLCSIYIIDEGAGRREQLRPNPAFHVVIVETVDHPGDATLLALGRAHFAAQGSPVPPDGRTQRVA
jgi:hypothetical protein